MSTSLNRRALMAGAATLPALTATAAAHSALAPNHGVIEELWKERQEGVARWKAHQALVRQQSAKLPKWSKDLARNGPE